VHHGIEKTTKCMPNGNVYDWSNFRSVVAASNSANINAEMGTLSDIHIALCDKAANMFPQYKGRATVKRRSMPKIINDLHCLGSSLVNKAPSKDLDRIFHGQVECDDIIIANDDGDDSQSLVQELIEAVSRLTMRVISLEKEVTTTKCASPPFITDDETRISDHRTVGPIVASTIANMAIANGTTSSEDNSDDTTSSFQISRRHKRRLSRPRKKKNELLSREQALLQSDNKVPVTIPIERSKHMPVVVASN